MNRPVPHIGATVASSRALSHYTHLAEQARLERERAELIDAALQVDALIDRVRLSPQFVATPDEQFEPQSVSAGVFNVCFGLIVAVILFAGCLA